jgi:hypothetical protein
LNEKARVSNASVVETPDSKKVAELHSIYAATVVPSSAPAVSHKELDVLSIADQQWIVKDLVADRNPAEHTKVTKAMQSFANKTHTNVQFYGNFSVQALAFAPGTSINN